MGGLAGPAGDQLVLDRVEGIKSFMEKRPAKFPDHVPTDLPDIWGDWTPPEYS